MNVFRQFLVALVVISVLGSSGAAGVAFAQSAAPQISDAVAFEDADGFVTGNSTIELRFEDALDESTIDAADVVVGLRDGSKATVVGIESGANPDDQQVFVDLGPTRVSAIETISYADSTVNVTTTSTTLSEGTGNENRPVFRGETVALVGDNASEQLVIRSVRDGRLLNIVTVPDDGQVYALDTGRFENDTYSIAFDDDTTFDRPNGADDDGDGEVDEDRLLQLLDYHLDLSVNKNPNVDDATVTDTENVTGTVSTRRVFQNISVSILDYDEETVRSPRTVRTNGSGKATFDFAPIAIDEADDHFLVVARHPSSGTTVTRDIKVSQIDYEAGLDSLSVTQQRGDVVEIPVVMSPDVGDKVAVNRATVTVGGPDVGYRANVTVSDWNDDQEVLLRWNTYLADGQDGATEFTVEPTDEDERDDAITVHNVSTTVDGGPDDVVDAGSYDVSVRSGADSADEPANTTGVVFLTDRSTTSLTAWTAPDDEEVPLTSTEEIAEATAEGTFTETSTVATGDRAVFALEASGIEGAITENESGNATERFRTFLEDGATLETVQTNPGPNRVGKAIDVGDSVSRVVVDDTNDTYYLVVSLDGATVTEDTDGDGVADAGEPSASLDDGDRFETTFEIPETDGGLASAPENVSVTWRYVEPSAAVDTTRVDGEDVALVAPDTNQSITGETSVAPGTDLRVRIRDDAEGVAFLDETTVTVSENRTWRTNYSFEGVPNGTPFTVTVRRGPTILEEADGLVQVRSSTTSDETSGEPSTATVANSEGSEDVSTIESTTGGSSSEKATEPSPPPSATTVGGATTTGDDRTNAFVAPTVPYALLGIGALAGIVLLFSRRE